MVSAKLLSHLLLPALLQGGPAGDAATVPGVRQVQLKFHVVEVADRELRVMASFLGLGKQTGWAMGFAGDPERLVGLVKELRQEGRAKVLAEPCLVTLSGRTAALASGPSDRGGKAELVPDSSLALDVLPIVMKNGKIYLGIDLAATTVTPSRGPAGTNRHTRSMAVKIEVNPGQMLVLGYQNAAGRQAPRAEGKGSGSSSFWDSFAGPSPQPRETSGMLIFITAETDRTEPARD
jgi:Flp pilus assembly secretin CpaC